MNSPVRIVPLWMILVLAVAFVAELGAATGLLSRDILDELARNSARWWGAPSGIHALVSLLLALLLVRLLGKAAGFPGPRDLLRALRGGGRPDAILRLLAVLIVAYAVVNQFDETARVNSPESDFGVFYDAAVGIWGGSNPYTATGAAYFYPPTFAFYFSVLTGLPKEGASLLWFTIKLALVIWSLAAVYGLFAERAGSEVGRRWLAVGVVFVAARFFLADLRFGNVNTFVLWLSLAAVTLDFRRKSMLAGLAAAAAVSIKLVPAVFLVYFLVRGRYRVVLWTGAWLVALNLLPFVATAHHPGELWASYLETGVYEKLDSRLAQPDNQSLWGALNRFFDLPFSQIRLIWVACSIVLTAGAAWVASRVRREVPARQAAAAALFFLLGLLVSPGSWVVHYGAVLLPMSCLLAVGVMGRSRNCLYAAVFVVANFVFTFSGWWRLTVRLSIENSLFVAANCLLFATLVFLVFETGSARRRSRDVQVANGA